MSGKIAVQQYLPFLSYLTKHGATRAEDIQKIVKECMTKKTLTKEDVLERLYALDIPEDKFPIFSMIVGSIENLKTEEEKNYDEQEFFK